jgi:hypothetical protein
MIRRLAAGVAALALVALAAPTQAVVGDTMSESCYKYDDGIIIQHVCLDVYWHWDTWIGIKVDDLTERVTSGAWENVAFDCNFIRVVNGNGVAQWAQHAPHCDIMKAPGYTQFHPRADMPNTSFAKVILQGYPKVNGFADPGKQTITVSLP